MKTAALLVTSAVLASQAAHAQFVDNDLYLGFNESGASGDYIINLGAASGIVGGAQVVTLSSDISLSTLNSIFGSPIGVGAGVVGAQQINGLSPVHDIYLTALRNGPGDNTVPNSTLANPVGGNPDAPAYTKLAQNMAWPNTAGGSSGSTTTPNTSWTATVGPALVTGNFYSDTGNDPISGIGSSGVLYEDLYYNSDANGIAYQYMGYFTLDMSGSSPALTFTPQTVPEPTVLSLLGGAGLLGLLLRRKSNRQNA
jgi:PEP-CTERM motif